MSHSAGNLLECFQYWETNTPEVIYLTQPLPDGTVVQYSWREVGEQVRRMAAHLYALELAPGSRIGILGKNSAHWIMADLAIWMAGHVCVPLYPTLNADTASYILDHAGVSLLFIGKLDGKADTWDDMRKGISKDLPLISLPMSPLPEAAQWEVLVSQRDAMQDIHQPQPSDLATIVYTSGSTGQPKGVMHSYDSMMGTCRSLQEMYGFNAQDRMLSYLPLAHVAERAAVEATSLYFGFQLFFAGDLSTFQADIKRARPTIFFSVPRLWTKFYLAILEKLPEQRQKRLFAWPLIGRMVKGKLLKEMGLNHVRAAITGSAPLPEHIVSWYRELGLELLDCYGMSENFGLSHASRPGQVRVGYVGQPAPGVTARIADNGELEVKSPGQMLGYYQQPDKTAEDTTEDGFFRTGDRGEIDELGRMRITGRVKELFKTSKGKYVAPVPIENRLAHCAHVESVCLTGPGQPQPFALMMLSEETREGLANGKADREALDRELAELLQAVNKDLEDHEKLDYLVIVDEPWTLENGYLTPTMKIRRSVIEGRYLPIAERWRAMQQPVIWQG